MMVNFHGRFHLANINPKTQTDYCKAVSGDCIIQDTWVITGGYSAPGWATAIQVLSELALLLWLKRTASVRVSGVGRLVSGTEEIMLSAVGLTVGVITGPLHREESGASTG